MYTHIHMYILWHVTEREKLDNTCHIHDIELHLLNFGRFIFLLSRKLPLILLHFGNSALALSEHYYHKVLIKCPLEARIILRVVNNAQALLGTRVLG